MAAACGTTTTTTVTTTTANATKKPNPSTQTQNVCQTNLNSATPADVIVLAPSPFTIVSVANGFIVNGNISAFEGTFQIAIKNASGGDIVPIVTGHAVQGQTSTPSPFSQGVSIPSNTSQQDACLWVFQYSAANGNPSKIQQVPIHIGP
jgi:hypothetical protein